MRSQRATWRPSYLIQKAACFRKLERFPFSRASRKISRSRSFSWFPFFSKQLEFPGGFSRD
ncbi:MAG: hypothetical protein CMQ27_06590 [Gammaproteobacteria bacterium]|nr:hypothetical protein [Gammaproteobacteria bacterium]